MTDDTQQQLQTREIKRRAYFQKGKNGIRIGRWQFVTWDRENWTFKNVGPWPKGESQPPGLPPIYTHRVALGPIEIRRYHSV